MSKKPSPSPSLPNLISCWCIFLLFNRKMNRFFEIRWQTSKNGFNFLCPEFHPSRSFSFQVTMVTVCENIGRQENEGSSTFQKRVETFFSTRKISSILGNFSWIIRSKALELKSFWKIVFYSPPLPPQEGGSSQARESVYSVCILAARAPRCWTVACVPAAPPVAIATILRGHFIDA